MCKTWTIKYTCDHFWLARLSHCHGTYTVQSKPGRAPRPSCNSAPTHVFRSNQACGDCQRAAAEATLELSLKDTSKASVEQLRQSELFRLYASLPTCRQYRTRDKAGRGRCGPRDRARGSLLKRELAPEEVVVGSWENRTAVGGGWDPASWGEYKSLSEEIAEAGEIEPMSLDLPMTGSMHESMDEYLSAFEQEPDGSDAVGEDGAGPQQPEDLLWSTAWTDEPSEGMPWTTTKGTTCWGAETVADSIAPLDLGNPLLPCEATAAAMNDDNAAVTRHAELPVVERVDTAASFPSDAATRSPPSRRDRSALRRRSTIHGSETKEELCNQLRCLQLPHFITVGGD